MLLIHGDDVCAQDLMTGRLVELPGALGQLLDRLTVADAARSIATGPEAVPPSIRGLRESLHRLAGTGFCAAWFRRLPSMLTG